jgi:hypothetical protein
MQRFSTHTAERCGGDDRQWVEQLLCDDVIRPALANERIQINTVGQVCAS